MTLRSTSQLDSQTKASLAARAALDKQADDVVILDLRALSTVTDFFVVGTAASGRQIDAIKEHLEAVLAGQGASVWHTEGAAARAPAGREAMGVQWVLMDCGDVVIHLFDQPARDFYRLEELWADAPRVPANEA